VRCAPGRQAIVAGATPRTLDEAPPRLVSVCSDQVPCASLSSATGSLPTTPWRGCFRVTRATAWLNHVGVSRLYRQVDEKTKAMPVFMTGLPGQVGPASREVWIELASILASLHRAVASSASAISAFHRLALLSRWRGRLLDKGKLSMAASWPQRRRRPRRPGVTEMPGALAARGPRRGRGSLGRAAGGPG
jgi:hypothetical protein